MPSNYIGKNQNLQAGKEQKVVSSMECKALDQIKTMLTPLPKELQKEILSASSSAAIHALKYMSAAAGDPRVFLQGAMRRFVPMMVRELHGVDDGLALSVLGAAKALGIAALDKKAQMDPTGVSGPDVFLAGAIESAIRILGMSGVDG